MQFKARTDQPEDKKTFNGLSISSESSVRFFKQQRIQLKARTG